MKKDATIIVRMNAADVEILQKLAEFKGLSLSAYVRMLLREKTNSLKL